MSAAALLFLLAAGSGIVVKEVSPEACVDGLLKAPKGPFAAWLFCENALGSHLGVIYADQMAIPLDGGWSVSDRFWQQPVWAADVQSVAWSADSERLYVATGGVYGSGGLFQLNLRVRKSYWLVKPAPGHNLEITEVDEPTIRYRSRNLETDEITVGRVRIRRAGGNTGDGRTTMQ